MLAASAAILLFAPAAADLPEMGRLDADDCSTLDQYDSRIGVPGLLEQFEAMALTAEWCTASGGPCELPYLRRWDDPLRLAVTLGEGVGPTSGAARAALDGLDAGLTFVAETRGMQVGRMARFDGPTTIGPRDGVVLLAVASRDELPGIAAEWQRFLPGLDLEAAAKIGLSQDVACWAVASDVRQRPGHLVRGFVFLDADLPVGTLLHCGKEEAVNLFIGNDPIGDASLFDDSWGRGQPHPDLGEQFSSSDEVLLRLLYHRFLRPGMSAEAARAAASEAVGADCP